MALDRVAGGSRRLSPRSYSVHTLGLLPEKAQADEILVDGKMHAAIEAAAGDGVLTLKLPGTEGVKPREITIDAV